MNAGHDEIMKKSWPIRVDQFIILPFLFYCDHSHVKKVIMSSSVLTFYALITFTILKSSSCKKGKGHSISQSLSTPTLGETSSS